MRVKSLKNTSQEKIRLVLSGGTVVYLPPGEKITNLRIENLDEVRGRADIVSDLGEINEKGHPNRTQLFDRKGAL